VRAFSSKQKGDALTSSGDSMRLLRHIFNGGEPLPLEITF